VFAAEVAGRAQCDEIRVVVVGFVAVEVVDVERLDILLSAAASRTTVTFRITISPEQTAASLSRITHV